jgi:hypothetical protein
MSEEIDLSKLPECTDYPTLSNDRNVNKWFKQKATNHTFSGKSEEYNAILYPAYIVAEGDLTKGFKLQNDYYNKFEINNYAKYLSIDDPTLQTDLKKIGICYSDIKDIYWGKHGINAGIITGTYSDKNFRKERVQMGSSTHVYSIVVLIDSTKYNTMNPKIWTDDTHKYYQNKYYEYYEILDMRQRKRSRGGGTRKKNKRSRKTRRRRR